MQVGQMQMMDRQMNTGCSCDPKQKVISSNAKKTLATARMAARPRFS